MMRDWGCLLGPPGGESQDRMWWEYWAEQDTRQNPPMAQSTAERQKAFKEAMKQAGYVRLEAWVTLEQREKFRQIGGDEWLRKKIDAAKPKEQR